jgi:iron complex outermembrane receptor protein
MISNKLPAYFGALLPFVAISPASAETNQQITVTAWVEGAASQSFDTRRRLEKDAIDLLDSSTADDILRRLPSVNVPINSRGEAIAFVRNAGERQVAVFFEGADINIPWDNRLDLSLVPAGLIGGANLVTGPLAPHYGVNALGALGLHANDALRGRLSYGFGNRFDADAAIPIGPLVVGGGYSRRDGVPLSAQADLPFSQSGRTLRDNTDARLANVFGRIAAPVGKSEFSLTAFHIWGAKGIAAEGHRATGARFWRYPAIDHTLVVANARVPLGASTDINSVAWFQSFGQRIDSHRDARFETVASRQFDRDRTWGLRELLTHSTGNVKLTGSLNFLESTHRQHDISFSAGGASNASDPLLYRQRNWSVGGEAEVALTERLRFDLALGHDAVNYVRTGDKPPVKGLSDWTGRVALRLDGGDGWAFRMAGGRKMRAPTLRERFGEGINRFLPNPDLLPERVLSAEVSAEWRGRRGGFYVTPFVQDLKNAIDQRNVGSLRQRINLAGSHVAGLETGADLRIDDRLHLSGNLTWSAARRKQVALGELNRLAEKPALSSAVDLKYNDPNGNYVNLEGRYFGRAYSADVSGDLVPLARSATVNLGFGHRFRAGDRQIDLFLQLDNIADTLVEPQLGLPAAGRDFRIGVRFR